jgi:hypothetical protein
MDSMQDTGIRIALFVALIAITAFVLTRKKK